MAETVERDKLGFGKEFEESPSPEPQPSPEAQGPVKEFVREIDLGDGAGKQVFKADSYEALVDKLAEAQTHASRKIRELSQERKAREPERRSSDWQELQPQALKPEEFSTLQNDPRQLFRRMMQAETGLTPEEFRQQENERRRYQAEQQAQNDFVRKHAEEYVPTPKNAEKIYRLLQNESLPISKRNLDWAFEQLRGELEGKPAPPVQERPITQPEAQEGHPRASSQPVPQAERSRSTPPSFLRPSLGGRNEAEGGGQDAEIARIAQSQSLPEMKARIEQYFKQQRSSAR